jgi:hypothetical protein
MATVMGLVEDMETVGVIKPDNEIRMEARILG